MDDKQLDQPTKWDRGQADDWSKEGSSSKMDWTQNPMNLLQKLWVILPLRIIVLSLYVCLSTKTCLLHPTPPCPLFKNKIKHRI